MSEGDAVLRKYVSFFAFGISTFYIVSIDITALLFKAASTGASPDSGPMLAPAVTNVFLKILAVLFVLGFLQLIARWSLISDFAGSIPAHATAIGVLGTFVGIFVGLYNFDANDLEHSVPLLIDGMKLAFSTSIAGLATSTGLKISHSIMVSISDSEDPWALGSGSALEAMEGIDHALFLSDQSFDTLIERLEKTQAVTGETLPIERLLDAKSLTHRLARLTDHGFDKFLERLERIHKAAS